MRRKFRALFLSSLLVSAGYNAHAAQVEFTNGDILSGQIISMRDARTLYFRSNSRGDMRIPWSQIGALYDDQRNLINIQTSRYSTDEIAYAEINGRSAQLSGLDIPRIEGSSVPEENQGFKWSGRFNFGGSIDKGNTEGKSAIFDADIKARDKNNRFNFGGELNWEEEDDIETENNQMIFGEYDRFLTDQWFVGSTLKFEKDKFENLDLRSRVGLLSGYQFYERDDLNFQIKGGAEYIHESYKDDSSESDIAATWALDYDQKFFDEAFQLFHKHDLAVPVDETDAYLFNSETGIRVPVGKHLTGTAQADFDWDNAPAKGVKEDDTSYSLKIGYEW